MEFNGDGPRRPPAGPEELLAIPSVRARVGIPGFDARREYAG